jgi:heme/copper-type cytochrome/quinol oxidase subunit 4
MHAPFVLWFMVLLVVAAVFLAVGLEWLANEVAIYAYFALVVGVVLQLVCFLKQKDRECSST